VRAIEPRPPDSTSGPLPGVLLEAEIHLRTAARALEWAGIADPDLARVGRIVFRLAQRVAVVRRRGV
jgi:hypothetical protein